jgi:hypothetical protein
MGNLMRYRLERVGAMPAALESGVLYVSDEYETAAHLCACGCGSKVRTPLGPTEWTVDDDDEAGPSLHPSVGNWQRPCRSHYVIAGGEVHWSNAWTDQQVEAGRHGEQHRRDAYYFALNRGRFGRLLDWFRRIFRR